MAEVIPQRLLEPISDDLPSGENLEYDSLFLALEESAQGQPERQIGETLVPAEGPDWGDVRGKSLELLARTKDLRVAVHFARASLVTGGLAAFRDCLLVIHGFVDRFWESVHPQLDPEDDHDPTHRVNTLSSLSDLETTLRLLDRAELVRAPRIGSVTLRDWEIGCGERSVSADPSESADSVSIQAVFGECELEDLVACDRAAREASEHVGAIEATVTDRVGADRACSLEPLVKRLGKISQALAEPLARRGAVSSDSAAGQPEGAAAEGPAGPGALAGAIRSREDVVRVLDEVCKYYARYEPSSPVPLLLKRARRIATKDFVEVIRDLAPKALDDVRALGGIDNEETSS